VCGKEIQRRRDRLAKEPACGYKCNGINRGRDWAKHGHRGPAAVRRRADQRGAKNPAWKGGITYKRPKGNHNGARYVRAPKWALPMARKDGYVMEHRLVMARRVGRLLTRAETVHHLDHDPLHNVETNLELWPTNGSHKMGEVGRIAPGAACRLSLAV